MASPAVGIKIDDYCRLCNKVKSDLRCIFENPSIVQNIRRHLHIFILEVDNLSKYVCASCVDGLETTVQFISDCHQAQRNQNHTSRKLSATNDGETPVPACDMQTDVKEECSDETTENEDFNSTDIKFTWTDKTLSPAPNGGPNTSLTIQYQPDGWSELSRLSDERKKQLGKILYDKYKNEISQERHKTVTLFDIGEELTKLDGPLLEGNTQPSSNGDTGRKDIPNDVIGSVLSALIGPAEDGRRLNLQCSLCSFTTSKNWYLNQHYNDTHAKPYTCEQCGKGFGDANKLRRHVQTEHTDRSPMTCIFCKEKFTQRYHYMQHIQTHKGNKAASWTCDECGEQFNQLHKLHLHRTVRHKSEEMPCPHWGCSFLAKSKYHLKQHDREIHHKTFECHYCGKKVSKKIKLEEHIKCKHLKIPYECDACHSLYSSKKWYGLHIEKCPQRVFMRQAVPDGSEL